MAAPGRGSSKAVASRRCLGPAAGKFRGQGADLAGYQLQAVAMETAAQIDGGRSWCRTTSPRQYVPWNPAARDGRIEHGRLPGNLEEQIGPTIRCAGGRTPSAAACDPIRFIARSRPPRRPYRGPPVGAGASAPEPSRAFQRETCASTSGSQKTDDALSQHTRTRSPMTGRPSMTRLTAVSIAARKTASSIVGNLRTAPGSTPSAWDQRNDSGGAGRRIHAHQPRPDRPGARPPPPSPRCCSRKSGGKRKTARPS